MKAKSPRPRNLPDRKGKELFRSLLERDLFDESWCANCGRGGFFGDRWQGCPLCGGSLTPLGDWAARRITQACRKDPTLVRRIKAEWVEFYCRTRPSVDTQNRP